MHRFAITFLRVLAWFVLVIGLLIIVGTYFYRFSTFIDLQASRETAQQYGLRTMSEVAVSLIGTLVVWSVLLIFAGIAEQVDAIYRRGQD